MSVHEIADIAAVLLVVRTAGDVEWSQAVPRLPRLHPMLENACVS
jgi:hypothetical protein